MPLFLNFFSTRAEQENTISIRISTQPLSVARRISCATMTDGSPPSGKPPSLIYELPLLLPVSSAAGVGWIIYHLDSHLSETNPPNENALIEYLDESSRTWEPCILASSKWSLQNQEYLVRMLNNFKTNLSVICFTLPS